MVTVEFVFDLILDVLQFRQGGAHFDATPDTLNMHGLDSSAHSGFPKP